MEEEVPKIRPERIEIEEKKEGPPPTHGMQTRSKGSPNVEEKFQQEEYDPLGNLMWKGTVYDVANWGNYKAYDVILNLISYGNKSPGSFKYSFVKYAREKENDRRSYDTTDNKGYITKAVEILEDELNNDKPSIALTMKYIIDKNPNILKGFKNIYTTRYAEYLKK